MKSGIIATVLMSLMALSQLAQAQDSLDITEWFIGGGGTTSGGGDFTLIGAIGQPQAGDMSGGDFTLSGGIWSSPNAGVPAGLCGDANLDAVVNIADAVLTLKKAVGLASFTPEQDQNADINHDGSIDVSDAVRILRISVQLDPPCQF